ncbi:hypothetical protein [Bradyrhizobium sp. LHD-71]|uniref:COG4223 family protein n=1 Tax=Bradyrhizobium sp. LHD-71 TaxID=3072141 RepID=UPI00280D930C|nr:hypothetical protein [Bradyrhizobium sp. LHD-71]MDQ8729678.1 hypothetical protein [Bradyrhizobium sp. LHD-71]
MSDERKDEASAEEAPKRAPPTIDLDASEVSGDTQGAGTFTKRAGDGLSALKSRGAAVLPALLPLLSGAVAALLVLAALWAGGLIAPMQISPPSVSPAQFGNVAASVGDLGARLARVEAIANRPAASAGDPARIEALETSLAAVRDEVAKLSNELRDLTASLNEAKSTPRDSAPTMDLAALSERLTRLEDTTKALSVELAKPRASAADDASLRRIVVANALDVAVRSGEPYAAALAVAKQVATNPASLAPLEAHAATGIPSEATYMREIVAVLQRLANSDAAKAKRTEPSAAESSSASVGVLDRLQSGLAKLVRIERSDGAPDTKSSPPSPAAQARSVRRDDLAAARQDVATLPQAGDPQIQAWLNAVDGREAALAAAQKFATDALAAFSKSGQ